MPFTLFADYSPMMTENTHLSGVPFHMERRLPEYVFTQVAELVKAARAKGHEVTDLSMGSPDMPPAPEVIDALKEAVELPGASRYSVSEGTPELLRAVADYYGRRFGVALDPETEIVATLGSKNAFANFAQAIVAPGDVILVPDPSYPIHKFGFVMAGGFVRPLPCAADDAFFRVAEQAVRESVPKPSAMVINFPSNPTALTADLAFYREAVAFARKYGIILLSDLAYAEIYYGDKPPSVFEVDGAKDVAIEFTSASKSFSMAGWRVGFAAGNARLVSALKKVKSYLDYGGFPPVQKAAAIALGNAEAITDGIRRTYRARLEALLSAGREGGWSLPRPDASMFVWAKLPEGEADSLAFCRRMVEEAGVALSPGIGFGPGGEGHVRIALVADEPALTQAMGRLTSAL